MQRADLKYVVFHSAKDPRWFLSYRVYDEATLKILIMKEFDMNKLEGHREHSRIVRICILELNLLLSEGAYMKSAEDK